MEIWIKTLKEELKGNEVHFDGENVMIEYPFV